VRSPTPVALLNRKSLTNCQSISAHRLHDTVRHIDQCPGAPCAVIHSRPVPPTRYQLEGVEAAASWRITNRVKAGFWESCPFEEQRVVDAPYGVIIFRTCRSAPHTDAVIFSCWREAVETRVSVGQLLFHSRGKPFGRIKHLNSSTHSDHHHFR
jgi:hypothetical protein